jgi:hypothetical protein
MGGTPPEGALDPNSMVRMPQSGIGHDANAYQPNDFMIYNWLKRFGVPQERA